MSHPSRGAWIEICITNLGTMLVKSHPSRGAWIEISHWEPAASHHYVAPLTGCVD